MIGYSAHGRGPLAPPEPTCECASCSAMFYYWDDLDGDAWCEDCQTEYCKDCGEAKEDPDDEMCHTCTSVRWADTHKDGVW